MRALAFCVLVAIVQPAIAQDTTLTTQLGTARQLFMQGLPDDRMMDGGYYEAITADIGGTWVDAGALDETAPEAFDRMLTGACERVPIALTIGGPFTLTMTQVAGGGIKVETTLTHLGGTSFAAHVDPKPYLQRLGIFERLETASQQALFALFAANAIFDVFRPSSDVMVLTSTRAFPRILLRCSPVSPVIAGGDAAGPDDAELREAIGKAFDSQFGGDVDPAKRQAFVDCAMPVFSPLTADDRRMVIGSNFNPPAEERERIEAAYPDLAAGAMACAEAADSSKLP